VIKVSELARGNILSITGACANEYEEQRCIVPAWKRGLSNTTINSGSGDYDGGDAVISQNAYEVDGDLLLTVGWGDGFAIRRLNNDGSMTRLYHSTYALYRDTTLTYNHMTSIAIHKASGTCALSTYNVNGYSWIDYSDLKTGGSTVVNTRPASQYIFSTGVNIDRTGSYYTNGTVTAGDWLYIGDHDATHYKKFPRRHWTNGTQELIDGTSASYIYSGAKTVDRNGYRYSLFYDEVNDRVFYNAYYGGNFMLIVDASTANPKCVWCDMGDIGLGVEGYETGVFIPDPVNQPNKIVIGCNSRHAYVDITNCFSNGNATIITQFYTESSTDAQRFGNLFRAGTKFQGFSGDATDRWLAHPEFHPTSADRGRNMLDGWFDYDNGKIVGLYRYNNMTEDTTTGGRGRSYYADYSSPLFQMSSANGTKYWIKLGYGFDGYSFKIWPDSVGPGLIGNWEAQYGTYTLTNSQAIEFVHLETVGHFLPSGCSIAYYVSNNGGSSWEAYTENSEGVHFFSTTGTSLRVKYIASGFEHKAPYKMALQYDSVTYGNQYAGIRQNLPIKVSRFRIRGRTL
jgi:hypothetical protein